MAKSTPESRLRNLRRKRLAHAKPEDKVIKLRSYKGWMVTPANIDKAAEAFTRFFRLGRRGSNLWAAVWTAVPEASVNDMIAAGGKTARRVFDDARMKQSYRYQPQSAPGAA